MSALIIENLPEHLRLSLEAQAARHRRSVADEATAILKQGITKPVAGEWPAPFKVKTPLTNEIIERAKRATAEVAVGPVATPNPEKAPMTDEQIELLRVAESAHRPFEGGFPLTDEFLDHAKREGRA